MSGTHAQLVDGQERSLSKEMNTKHQWVLHHKVAEKTLTVTRTARSQFESTYVFHAFNLRRTSAGRHISTALTGDFAHFVRLGAVLRGQEALFQVVLQTDRADTLAVQADLSAAVAFGLVALRQRMWTLGGRSAAARLVGALALRTAQLVALLEGALLIAARSLGWRAQSTARSSARLRLRIVHQVRCDVARIAAGLCTLFHVVAWSEREELGLGFGGRGMIKGTNQNDSETYHNRTLRRLRRSCYRRTDPCPPGSS